ncbi:MAG: methylenetetrahydrofolate reductase C-terminal domain-containing protein [Bacteroidetes bacterium]|nr:methylenetetrahydrofolate reductase C-terminal domain-containing protein [Bacteroidota bacterium]
MSNNFVSKGKPITPGERKISRIVLLFEDLIKVPIFGCQRCGECILSSTGFVCSQRCPKRLRNGPCGGTAEGGYCEVYPERKCVWYKIHKRSRLLGRMSLLYKLNNIHNWNLEGTSAWLNVFMKRIAAPAWFVRNDKKKVKEILSNDAQRKN